jgi:hypothetical protein
MLRSIAVRVHRRPEEAVVHRSELDAMLVGVLSALKSESGTQLYEGFFLEVRGWNDVPFHARFSAGRAGASRGWTSGASATSIQTGSIRSAPVRRLRLTSRFARRVG